MARSWRVVKIPKPAPAAFNKNRAAGHLLQAQSIHLRHALSKHVQEAASHLKKAAELLAVDPGALKTEEHISEYAKRVMAILHPQKKPAEK